MNEKFAKPVCRWEVEVTSEGIEVRHDGWPIHPVDATDIDVVRKEVAGVIERTIKAMPANNCSRLTLIGLWK